MKTLFLIIILTATLFPLLGQEIKDSLRYSQENGTLEKQRFIDQYDYVFMTKEPTKWMLKTQASNNFTFGGLVGAYERKISPSISLGVGTYFRPVSLYPSLHAGVFAEMKYYYDMKKRMAEGKSANNFSGNYVGISMTQSFSKLLPLRNPQPFSYGIPGLSPLLDAFEVRWGMQRRFFNHGIIDFGVSLGMISSDNREIYQTERKVYREFLFQTQWSLGTAWGDFKRSKLPPTCDVLRCYDHNTQLLKIAWPHLIIGSNRQSLATSFAFEKQLGKSRFSLNIQNDLQLGHWSFPNYTRQIFENKEVDGNIVSTLIGEESVDFSFFSVQSISYLQPRFYFKKKTNVNSPLSGLYTGISLMHVYENYRNKSNNDVSNYTRYHALELGPSLGFQQKVFRHGYVDLGLTVGKVIRNFNDKDDTKIWSFRPNLKLGFAF